jgi:hypothetical protein
MTARDEASRGAGGPARRDETVLEGEVEIDGLYALGHVRPKNRKEERVDRRLPENQSPDRVVAPLRDNARQRSFACAHEPFRRRSMPIDRPSSDNSIAGTLRLPPTISGRASAAG